jgi:hypothetical protein
MHKSMEAPSSVSAAEVDHDHVTTQLHDLCRRPVTESHHTLDAIQELLQSLESDNARHAIVNAREAETGHVALEVYLKSWYDARFEDVEHAHTQHAIARTLGTYTDMARLFRPRDDGSPHGSPHGSPSSFTTWCTMPDMWNWIRDMLPMGDDVASTEIFTSWYRYIGGVRVLMLHVIVGITEEMLDQLHFRKWMETYRSQPTFAGCVREDHVLNDMLCARCEAADAAAAEAASGSDDERVSRFARLYH